MSADLVPLGSLRAGAFGGQSLACRRFFVRLPGDLKGAVELHASMAAIGPCVRVAALAGHAWLLQCLGAPPSTRNVASQRGVCACAKSSDVPLCHTSLEGGANGSPHCFGTCIHTHLRGRWVSIVPTDFDLWAASAPLRGSGPSASFAAGASPVARRGSRLAEVRRGVLAPTL